MFKKEQSPYRYLKFKNGTFRRYVQEKETEQVQAPVVDPAAQVHGTYGGLLFDKRWLEKRSEILLRDGNKCFICSASQELQVHHRQYHFVKKEQKFKPPWDYPDHLLVTLCEKCHRRGHNLYKVPIIHI